MDRESVVQKGYSSQLIDRDSNRCVCRDTVVVAGHWISDLPAD